MKRRWLCLLLIAVLLFGCTARADSGADFYRQSQYGALESYENLVYGYSMMMYSGFTPMSDEMLEVVLQHYDDTAAQGGDAVYDTRVWESPDGMYQIEFQIKEQTYESYEVELLHAPYYLDVMGDQFGDYFNVRMLHEGRLHGTPIGTMLETAIAYDEQYASGRVDHHLFIYYDLYARGVEYCLTLNAANDDYDAAIAILNEIANTLHFIETSPA